MHTILGTGGPVSNALAKELLLTGENVRLVCHRKLEMAGKTTWVGADLKNYQQVLAGLHGNIYVRGAALR